MRFARLDPFARLKVTSVKVKVKISSTVAELLVLITRGELLLPQIVPFVMLNEGEKLYVEPPLVIIWKR